MRAIHAVLVGVMLSVVPVIGRSDDKKPPATKPADKPTDGKAPVDKPAADAKAADAKPTDTKPTADAKAPVDSKPTENKPVDKSAAPAEKPTGKHAPEKKPAAAPLSAANLQLKDVIAKTEELKNKVKDTRASLQTISEEVFRADAAGARADVSLTNEMSSAYRLQHIVLLLDNNKVTDRLDDNGSLADSKQLPLFSGVLSPGEHTFALQLEFKGHGYGVFKYLEGYTFKVKSSHVVSANTSPVTLGITAFEKGDQSTALDARPTVEWKETMTKK